MRPAFPCIGALFVSFPSVAGSKGPLVSLLPAYCSPSSLASVGTVVTLFLALVAVQFVSADVEPSSRNLMASQQLVIITVLTPSRDPLPPSRILLPLNTHSTDPMLCCPSPLSVVRLQSPLPWPSSPARFLLSCASWTNSHLQYLYMGLIALECILVFRLGTQHKRVERLTEFCRAEKHALQVLCVPPCRSCPGVQCTEHVHGT